MKMVNTTNLNYVFIYFQFKSDSECTCLEQMVNTNVPKSVCLVYRFEFSRGFIDPALAVVICIPKPLVLGSSGFGMSCSIWVQDMWKKLVPNLHRGLEPTFGCDMD